MWVTSFSPFTERHTIEFRMKSLAVIVTIVTILLVGVKAQTSTTGFCPTCYQTSSNFTTEYIQKVRIIFLMTFLWKKIIHDWFYFRFKLLFSNANNPEHSTPSFQMMNSSTGHILLLSNAGKERCQKLNLTDSARFNYTYITP